MDLYKKNNFIMGNQVKEKFYSKCPSCSYTDDVKFRECPNCGIIVEKFLLKLERDKLADLNNHELDKLENNNGHCVIDKEDTVNKDEENVKKQDLFLVQKQERLKREKELILKEKNEKLKKEQEAIFNQQEEERKRIKHEEKQRAIEEQLSNRLSSISSDIAFWNEYVYNTVLSTLFFFIGLVILLVGIFYDPSVNGVVNIGKLHIKESCYFIGCTIIIVSSLTKISAKILFALADINYSKKIK